MEIRTSILSPGIALEINSGSKWDLQEFLKKSTENEYLPFWSHFSFFYRYPGLQFVRVIVHCHLCKSVPERNYAGIGSIHLLNNGVNEREILISKNGEKQWVKNSIRYSKMICLCNDCVGSHFPFGRKINIQLSLFNQSI